MVDYKFVDVSDELSDFVVDAEFEVEIPPYKVQEVLSEVCEAVLIGTKFPILFQGLSSVHITTHRIEIAFRFSRNPEEIRILSSEDRNELPRIRTQFVIHIFARLDRIAKLGAIPFPPNFRDFVDFKV